MVTKTYLAQYSSPEARQEALKRYNTRNANSFVGNDGLEGLERYKIGCFQAELVSEGKKDLTIIVDAPAELIDSYVREMQAHTFLDTQLRLDGK